MPKYADVEKAEAWLHREDWGTPDERWRPESEFGAMLDSLQRIDVVPTELYKMDRLAFFRALKRLTHLLKSDYIRSFDEVDPKTGEYKRDIMEADVEKVRHGKWIEEQAQHVVYRLKCRAAWVKYTCPFCGKKNGRYKSNYCSNCGAKMDGGKE